MFRIFSAILALFTWALWFGGMIALFIFVTNLFNGDRNVAIEAAPRMFVVFQKYQLILAAIALVAVVGWRVGSPSKSIVAAFVLLAAAAGAAVTISIAILPRMEELRRLGESSSPEFMRLHGRSMILYLCEVLLLVIAGITMMAARRDRSAGKQTPGKSPRTDRPTDSPA